MISDNKEHPLMLDAQSHRLRLKSAAEMSKHRGLESADRPLVLSWFNQGRACTKAQYIPRCQSPWSPAGLG